MSTIAVPAGLRMVRRYPFCGHCGAGVGSEHDQYCEACGQSLHGTGATPRPAASWWHWRFLLVIPAFIVGIIVPGLVVRISTELGSLIPGGDALFMPMAELGQSVTDGVCAVLFPRAVAPRSKTGISLAAALVITVIVGLLLSNAYITNYYAGVGGATVIWQVALMLTTIAAAGVAALYARVQTRPG